MEQAEIDKLINRRVGERLALRRMQEREKMLSETRALAIAVSHKLRNRLGLIQTAIYNIKQRAAHPKIRSSIDKIENSVLESSEILVGLLAFARIEMPIYEDIDIRDILDECLEKVRADFVGWNVTVTREYGSVDQLLIRADPLELKEALGNLLRNAYQALSDRQGAIEIELSRNDDAEEIAVCIRDNGEGMDGADLARIREPFFSTRRNCLGLGLTTCCRIVDLHGGRIEIESAPGRGTAVTVHLPCRAPYEAA